MFLHRETINTFSSTCVIIRCTAIHKVIRYDITYMQNPKHHGTSEPIYRTERQSQMWKTNLWLPRRRGGGVNLDTGIDIHTLLYIKWITNKKVCCDPRGRNELDTTERLNWQSWLIGTSVAAQWLGLHLPVKKVWVSSLVGELRSHMQKS